jgi:hypothetical protein
MSADSCRYDIRQFNRFRESAADKRTLSVVSRITVNVLAGMRIAAIIGDI